MCLVSIVNELVVKNVKKSIEFYEINFGFLVEFTDGNPVNWAQLKKDNIVLMLEEYETVKKEINIFPKKTDSSNLIKFQYSDVCEVKSLNEILKSNKIEFFDPYHETDYGKAEFGIYDPDRNMIIVSAEIK